MSDSDAKVVEPGLAQPDPPGFEDLFALEAVSRNRFRSRTHNHGQGRIFGGLVIAQALLAAYRSVGERTCHSLHAYFLRPGDLKAPVIYEVEQTRDGGSFCTRRVTAVQNGEQIFNLAASFQAPEAGFEHQALAPQGLGSALDQASSSPSMIQAMIELRAVSAAGTDLQPTQKLVSVRARRPVGGAAPIQQAILAYASDIAFMEPALQPHGLAYGQPGFQGASLDHAVWFHRPSTLNDWIYFSQLSPSASGGRGLVLGQMFDSRGRLVASVAQECLMRLRRGYEGPAEAGAPVSRRLALPQRGEVGFVPASRDAIPEQEDD
jgi:acyl-CoA thioesterase-2